MGFQEMEPGVFYFIGDDVRVIGRYTHMVDDTLMPIRMEFMDADERKKAMILMERKAAMAAKAQAEREHADRLK